MAVVVLTAMAQGQPIAPPLPQQVADCARPTYATDQLVCADPRLLVLDGRLAASLARLPKKSVKGPLIEDQNSWFRRSRLCASQRDQAACVEAAYRERLAVVAATKPPPGVHPLTCEVADGRGASATRGDAIVLFRGASVIGVALPDSRNWHPFVIYSRSGKAVIVRDAAGKRVALCR